MRYVIRPAANTNNHYSYYTSSYYTENECCKMFKCSGKASGFDCNINGKIQHVDVCCDLLQQYPNGPPPSSTPSATPKPVTTTTKPLPSRFPSTINQTTGGDKAPIKASDSHGKSAHDRAQPAVAAAAPPTTTSADNTPNVTPSPSNDNDTSSCPSSDCSGALDLQCQFNKIACPLANQFNIPQGLMLPGAIGIIILLTMVFIIR